MGKIEELKKKYREALRLEDDFREKQYRPIEKELVALCNETRKAHEQLEEAQLEKFDASFEGDFFEADWSKLDIDWLLWSDVVGRGQKVYKYRENLFAPIKFLRPNGFYAPTNQVAFSVSMPKNADEAEIEEAASVIEKLFPYIKPFDEYRAQFDVFEDDLCETRHPVLSTKDGHMWQVRNIRWSDTYHTGTLRSALGYISQNLSYTFY